MSEEECWNYCTHDSCTIWCPQSCIVDWFCNIISLSCQSRDLICVPCFADSVCVLITIIYIWRDLLLAS